VIPDRGSRGGYPGTLGPWDPGSGTPEPGPRDGPGWPITTWSGRVLGGSWEGPGEGPRVFNRSVPTPHGQFPMGRNFPVSKPAELGTFRRFRPERPIPGSRAIPG
jgi:hypothetical protein